jgi:chemotaxis methyl-accepting protein methylase
MPTIRRGSIRRLVPDRMPASGEASASPDRPPLQVVGGLPAFVLARAGLSPEMYRHGPLDRRVPACLRALRVQSEPAAQARLSSQPELLDLALSTLLIGVSGLFRDAEVFDTLRAAVVPALGARRGTLRVLSLGCSGGAELYSLAILLDEAGLLDRGELAGCDCRRDAVARARAGVFTDDALADLDAGIRSRYFERAPSGWRVIERVRRFTTWRAVDATREIPAGPWDLVLCRNVTIYLLPSVVEVMFGRIGHELAPDGFLVVGRAERPPAALRVATVGRCVYRVRRDG